jgi:hypothetical protein
MAPDIQAQCLRPTRSWRSRNAKMPFLGPDNVSFLPKGHKWEAVGADWGHKRLVINGFVDRYRTVWHDRVTRPGWHRYLTETSGGHCVETVKVHMKHILKKLYATDRTPAVPVALRRGIIEL